MHMGYFADHYGQLRFPISDGNPPGFRSEQLAAIHAVAPVSRHNKAGK
jgi:hypothetical protein